MEGRLLTALPPERPRRRPMPDYDWDKFANLAQKNPENVVETYKHVRESRMKSVRLYTRPPFVTDEGHIVISFRNSAIEDDGVRYGDVYFQWQPNKQ